MLEIKSKDADTHRISFGTSVYIESDKKSFKECCINAAEWIYDFSSLNFSAKKMDDGKIAKPTLTTYKKNGFGRIAQLISLIAVMIIFPLGIYLACLKYSHHNSFQTSENNKTILNSDSIEKAKMQNLETCTSKQTSQHIETEPKNQDLETSKPTSQLIETEPKNVETEVTKEPQANDSSMEPGLSPSTDLSPSKNLPKIDPIQDLDLQKMINPNWIFADAASITKPWDGNFSTLRNLMIEKNTPIILFEVDQPKIRGVYIAFMLKVKHEDYKLEEDTIGCVVFYRDGIENTWILPKDRCEQISIGTESSRILQSFSGREESLNMTAQQANHLSSVNQQSHLPSEKQKSLTWLLYNVISKKQSLKISELRDFYSDDNIPNPSANWEIRLANQEEILADCQSRKAKQDATTAKIEATITDTLAELPLINLNMDELTVEDINKAMSEQKISVGQFQDGSIAFLLDVKHIDLKNQIYDRSLQTEKPIVLMMVKQKNGKEEPLWEVHNLTYEEILVLKKFTKQEALELNEKVNALRSKKGKESLPIEPEREYSYNLFKHFCGQHSLKLDSEKLYWFTVHSRQNMLGEDYNKSLAWIVYRLLNNKEVDLSENPVPLNPKKYDPSNPCGYWNLSLAKF